MKIDKGLTKDILGNRLKNIRFVRPLPGEQILPMFMENPLPTHVPSVMSASILTMEGSTAICAHAHEETEKIYLWLSGSYVINIETKYSSISIHFNYALSSVVIPAGSIHTVLCIKPGSFQIIKSNQRTDDTFWDPDAEELEKNTHLSQ